MYCIIEGNKHQNTIQAVDKKHKYVLYNMTIKGNYSGTKQLVLAYFYVQFCMEYGLTIMNEMNNEKTRNQAVGACSLVCNMYCIIWQLKLNYSGTNNNEKTRNQAVGACSLVARIGGVFALLLDNLKVFTSFCFPPALILRLFNKAQAVWKSYQKGLLAACSSVHHGCCGHR